MNDSYERVILFSPFSLEKFLIVSTSDTVPDVCRVCFNVKDNCICIAETEIKSNVSRPKHLNVSTNKSCLINKVIASNEPSQVSEIDKLKHGNDSTDESYLANKKTDLSIRTDITLNELSQVREINDNCELGTLESEVNDVTIPSPIDAYIMCFNNADKNRISHGTAFSKSKSGTMHESERGFEKSDTNKNNRISMHKLSKLNSNRKCAYKPATIKSYFKKIDVNRLCGQKCVNKPVRVITENAERNERNVLNLNEHQQRDRLQHSKPACNTIQRKVLDWDDTKQPEPHSSVNGNEKRNSSNDEQQIEKSRDRESSPHIEEVESDEIHISSDSEGDCVYEDFGKHGNRQDYKLNNKRRMVQNGKATKRHCAEFRKREKFSAIQSEVQKYMDVCKNHPYSGNTLDVTEEPVDFEIPPLHQKGSKCSSKQIRSGKWSQEESAILLQNWNNFVHQFKVEHPLRLIGCHCPKDEKNVKAFIQAKHLYIRLGRNLDKRTLKSIRIRMRNIFLPCNYEPQFEGYSGPWKINGKAVESLEEKKLHFREFYAKYGNKWNRMGQAFGISRQAAHTFAKAYLRDINIGSWSQQEVQAFTDAIKEVSSTMMVSCNAKNLPWFKITERVGTKNYNQVLYFWKQNSKRILSSINA